MGSTPRPRLLVCYLCGREYGSKSLGIHLPQCRKMFEAQEAKKPKGQRRKLPAPPPGYMEALNNVVLVPSSPRGGGSGLGGDDGAATPRGGGGGNPGGAAFGSSFTAASLAGLHVNDQPSKHDDGQYRPAAAAALSPAGVWGKKGLLGLGFRVWSPSSGAGGRGRWV